MRFDVLVLGGGTAGCVLAARLSENPDRSPRANTNLTVAAIAEKAAVSLAAT